MPLIMCCETFSPVISPYKRRRKTNMHSFFFFYETINAGYYRKSNDSPKKMRCFFFFTEKIIIIIDYLRRDLSFFLPDFYHAHETNESGRKTRIFWFYLPYTLKQKTKHQLYIYFLNAFCPAPTAALYTVSHLLLSPNGLSVCFLHSVCASVSLMTYVFTCAYIYVYINTPCIIFITNWWHTHHVTNNY